MKKVFIIVLLAVMIIISSCAAEPAETTAETQTETTAAETTSDVTTEQITTAAETAEETETEEITTGEAETEEVTAEEATTAEEITEEETTEETTTEETTAEEITTEEITTEEAETEEYKENAAYTVYKAAMEKTNTLTQAHEIMQTTQNIKLAVPGVQQIEYASALTADLNFNGLGGDDFKCELKESIITKNNGEEQVEDYDFYIDKDNFYLKDQEKGSYKVFDRGDVSFASINALISEENLKMEILSEPAFENAAVTENSDGTKTIKVTPSDESLKESYDKLSGKIQSVLSLLGAENMKFTGKNAEYVLTFSKDGYIIRSETKMNVETTVTIAGVTVKSTSEAQTVGEIIDPGQTITIEIPVVE